MCALKAYWLQATVRVAATELDVVAVQLNCN